VSTNSVDSVFEGKDPTLRTTFDYLLQQLEQFGTVKVAAKQTSIHLEKNSGFAGVHPRKNYFNIEFRTDYKIDAPRITRVQQLSARRFEHTVKVESPSDIDEEHLVGLKSAYELSK
jgi:hypothetical protein